MSLPTPNVGVLLFLPYRAMETRVMAALAEQGFDDLTLAQARVFQRIGPDGTRLGELAEQAQVTKQTAGFLVDQLERAGYVTRTLDPEDGRARRVRITNRGAQAQAAAGEVVEQVESEWEQHLGGRRMDALREALVRLRDITDPYA